MASKSSVFQEASAAAHSRKTESGARSAVQGVLARHGYTKMPKVEQGTYDRATVRIYRWADSPAGDVVMVAGPSFVPELHHFDDLKAPKDAEFAVPARPVAVPGRETLQRVSSRAAKSDEAQAKKAAEKAAAERAKAARDAERAEAAQRAQAAKARAAAKAKAEREAAEVLARKEAAEAAEQRKKAAAAKKRAAAKPRKAPPSPAPAASMSDAEFVRMMAQAMK